MDKLTSSLKQFHITKLWRETTSKLSYSLHCHLFKPVDWNRMEECTDVTRTTVPHFLGCWVDDLCLAGGFAIGRVRWVSPSTWDSLFWGLCL